MEYLSRTLWYALFQCCAENYNWKDNHENKNGVQMPFSILKIVFEMITNKTCTETYPSALPRPHTMGRPTFHHPADNCVNWNKQTTQKIGPDEGSKSL